LSPSDRIFGVFLRVTTSAQKLQIVRIVRAALGQRLDVIHGEFCLFAAIQASAFLPGLKSTNVSHSGVSADVPLACSPTGSFDGGVFALKVFERCLDLFWMPLAPAPITLACPYRIVPLPPFGSLAVRFLESRIFSVLGVLSRAVASVVDAVAFNGSRISRPLLSSRHSCQTLDAVARVRESIGEMSVLAGASRVISRMPQGLGFASLHLARDIMLLPAAQATYMAQ
jgi:hypothetical protein